MNIIPLALASLLSASALHAEWKVATVDMSILVKHCPEIIACNQKVEQAKLSITQNVRAQSLLDKKNEIQQINLDGRKVLIAYSKLSVKDEKGPEADRVREFRTRLRLAQDQYEALDLEFKEFQKEQLDMINQDMARTYRNMLNRLNVALKELAAARGFDLVYEISGSSNVGLPVLLYAKPGLTTDLTDDLKKMIDEGKIK